MRASFLRTPRWAHTLALAPLAISLTGCPSPKPEEKFDDFLDETEEEREEFQSMKQDMGSQLEDVNGTFLFAIETVISPGLYLQFITTTTLEISPDGSGGTMTLSFQPLSLDQGQNLVPREPVGEPIVASDIDVSPAGQFRVESLGGDVMVSGAANPITGGDIVADLGFEGFIQSEDLYCGTVFGDVSSPIQAMLTGSTFAAVRIEGTDPASLPTDIIAKCPEGVDGGTGGTGGTGDTGGMTTGG